MKAVILAAGQGTRIRAVHGERPKCLIKVDHTTILDHQIDGLLGGGNRPDRNCEKLHLQTRMVQIMGHLAFS